MDKTYLVKDWEVKLYFIIISLIIVITCIVSYLIGINYNNQQKPTQYESIKLGDKTNKVIVDDTTGCKYIVFNNKTLTPLYDKQGKVEGCGEDKND